MKAREIPAKGEKFLRNRLAPIFFKHLFCVIEVTNFKLHEIFLIVF